MFPSQTSTPQPPATTKRAVDLHTPCARALHHIAPPLSVVAESARTVFVSKKKKEKAFEYAACGRGEPNPDSCFNFLSESPNEMQRCTLHHIRLLPSVTEVAK
jgi:hypothetical protein